VIVLARGEAREAAGVTLASLAERKVGKAFFARDARVVARALIGTYLVHAPAGEAPRAARIVETEAYCGAKDLACHAKVGLTKRTKTLLGPPGRAYVFLIYGMYDCFNVTCAARGRGAEDGGSGHAVLVRGGEPVFGIAGGVRGDGPGRLARAMGITRALDGCDMTGETLFVSERQKRPLVTVTARVGVAYAGEWADRPWRFLEASSRHASRPSKRLIGRGV
jgi:DNA-3-methyladenine glycosylase